MSGIKLPKGLLEGKKGIIAGIANNMSIAWPIAKFAKECGAEIALSYPNDSIKKRVAPLAESIGVSDVLQCDVTDEASMDAMFSEIEKKWGKIDFIVHAIAFSDKDELRGRYADTSIENFTNTMNISCYSFVSMAKKAAPLMKDGGSMLTLTYLGSMRAIPNYNVMGVAKAALESSVRYLALDLGKDNIRVNAISAGPIRTLAASAIGDFKAMLDMHANSSPLKRNVSQEDVAGSAIYFLSDMSSGVTGEVHYVDAGYSIAGSGV